MGQSGASSPSFPQQVRHFAMLLAIRRASSLVSSLAAVRRPGSAFIINIAQRLTVSVPHDETIRRYFDGPRRREAAGCDSAVGLHSKAGGENNGKAGGFALTPQTTATSSGLSDRMWGRRNVPRSAQEKGDARSNEAIIHPRFAAWYKMGDKLFAGKRRL